MYEQEIQDGTNYIYRLWKPNIEMFGEFPGLPFWVHVKDGQNVVLQVGTDNCEILKDTDIDMLPAYEINIDLKKGWNMISLPVMPDDNLVDTIFAGKPIIKEATARWNPTTEEYQYGVSRMYQRLGYWVLATDDTFITITGKPTPTNYELVAGWNMVGSDAVAYLYPSEIPDMRSAYVWDASQEKYIEVTEVKPSQGAWLYVSAGSTYAPEWDAYHYHFTYDSFEYTQWVNVMRKSDGTTVYINPLFFNSPYSADMYLRGTMIWGSSPPPFTTTIIHPMGPQDSMPSIKYAVRHVAMMGRRFFEGIDPALASKINAKVQGWGFVYDIYDVLFGVELPTHDTYSGAATDLAEKYYHDCSVNLPAADDYHSHKSKVCPLLFFYITDVTGSDPLHYALSAINLYLKYGDATGARLLLDSCIFNGKGITGGVCAEWLPIFHAYSTIRLAVYAAARALIGDTEEAQTCANILKQLQWKGEHLTVIEGETRLHEDVGHIGGFFVGYKYENGDIVCTPPRPGFTDWLYEWLGWQEIPEYLGTIPTNAETTMVCTAALKMISQYS